MDFSLNEQQRLLQDEMAKAFERLSPLSRVREVAASTEGRADDIRKGLCEAGVPAVLIPQEFGGLGLGILEASLIAEQLGRFIVPAGYVASAVMAPLALTLAGSPQQKAELLPKLADGQLSIGVGISEFAAGARKGAGVSARDGRLTGSALFVLDCGGADFFIVADRDQNLHLVEARATGLAITGLDSIDRTRAVCELTFDGVEATALPVTPAAALGRMRDAGRVVLAADTLGASWHMLNQAVEYAGQRRQFGRAIGSFQAIKHICADMAAELEPGRSLMWYAAYAQDRALPDAPLATAHAKAYLCEAGRMIARKATEVHGGIGITDGLGLHYWFKRIGFNYQLLGSPERLRDDAARFQGWIG